MKRIFSLLKKPWFWILGIIVVGGGLYFVLRPSGPEVEFITSTVTRGEFIQEVEASGELEPIEDVDLSFGVRGTILEIPVEVGQEVTRDLLLATLDTEELDAEVQEAENAVRVAEARLAERRAGSTDEALLVADTSLGSTQAAADAAVVALEDAEEALGTIETLQNALVEERQVAFNSAGRALTDTRAQNAIDVNEARERLITTLQGNMVEVRSAISDADQVLAVENTIANDDFVDVLSILNTSLLSPTKLQYNTAKKARDDAEGPVFNLTLSSSGSSALGVIPLIETAFAETASLLLDTRRVLDATGTKVDFSISDLEALKTDVDSSRATLKSEQDTLVIREQAYNAAVLDASVAEREAEDALEAARVALARAEAERGNALRAARADVRSAKTALAIRTSDVARSEAQRSEVAASPRAVELAPLVADVEQAKARLEAALARRANAEILSPIDGIVADIKFDVGEQVTEADQILLVQSRDEVLRITVDVAESDVAKLQLGDTAIVEFDAFGRDVIAQASVAEIDPAEKLIEGVVFYETRMMFEGMPPFGLRPGMTVDVTITTERQPDVLLVPQRAVLIKNGVNIVRVRTGATTYEDRFVHVGPRGEGGLVTVIEGLMEGDEVILNVRE